MIIAVGVDQVDQERIAGLWRRKADRFLERVYTAGERAYCLAKARPVESLAARFAAKEAVMKCLGTGWASGVGFRQIEVVRAPRGAPTIALSGRAAEVARGRGIARIHVSLTHTDGQSIAVAVAEGDGR